jgi:hypothetical protein
VICNVFVVLLQSDTPPEFYAYCEIFTDPYAIYDHSMLPPPLRRVTVTQPYPVVSFNDLPGGLLLLGSPPFLRAPVFTAQSE